jgi:hypothetical protein
VRVGADVLRGYEGSRDAPSIGVGSSYCLVAWCGIDGFIFRAFRLNGGNGCPYISLCLF